MANKTWFHFIGGYYKSVEKFLEEAKRLGITRRIPAQIARGMNFGDKIILLRWENKRAMAFAEMTITNIMLDKQISEQVCQKLMEEGKAKPPEESTELTITVRECGSYISAEPWEVSAEISEIIETATEMSDDKLFVMIGGTLTKVYEQCVMFPGVKFTRGIIFHSSWDKNQYDFFGRSITPDDENHVVPISDYKKAI